MFDKSSSVLERINKAIIDPLERLWLSIEVCLRIVRWVVVVVLEIKETS